MPERRLAIILKMQYNTLKARRQVNALALKSKTFMFRSNDETPQRVPSWGATMPNVPNQYNYPGTHLEYFESIFYHEFHAYTVNRQENPLSDRTMVYAFLEDDQIKLVVEILSSHSGVNFTRKFCLSRQIPYLRFYFDHDGWWNTRDYVVDRIRKALG